MRVELKLRQLTEARQVIVESFGRIETIWHNPIWKKLDYLQERLLAI